MITAKQAKKIRKAIEPMNHGRHWTCWILQEECGASVKHEYARFFGQTGNGRWEGLNQCMGNSSSTENLQRELMLELFAHTRGKL